MICLAPIIVTYCDTYCDLFFKYEQILFAVALKIWKPWHILSDEQHLTRHEEAIFVCPITNVETEKLSNWTQ